MSTPEPTPESRELGRRIQAARIAAGFTTQGTAAAQLGKTREFVNRMESGKVVPYTPTLIRVILGLRLDPLDLFPEAAGWVGKSPADRWPEGHPNAELLKTIRGRGAPKGPRPPRPEPKSRAKRKPRPPVNAPRCWPRGFTITAAAISGGDTDTAKEEK